VIPALITLVTSLVMTLTLMPAGATAAVAPASAQASSAGTRQQRDRLCHPRCR
jgi:hypothetical protein